MALRSSSNSDGWTVSNEWKELQEKVNNATDESESSWSSSNSEPWMAALEPSEKPKERKTTEARSISRPGAKERRTASVGEERKKKLLEKAKERKATDQSGNISSPDGWTVEEEWKMLLVRAKEWEETDLRNLERRTEGLNLLEKDFQSTELSSSSWKEFVITAKAFKEMIPTDSDESVVLSDDFHDSVMEVSILVAGDAMSGNLKDILLMRYGFPSDKVIIRDSIYLQESLKLDWSNVCQAKLSFWLLRAEIETKSVRPFPFDYGEIHEDDCLDVASKFVSLIGMVIASLIINCLRGTHIVDTLELEAGHYDHERLQNLRSLLKKEDCDFAEIEGLINKLGEVMKILSSNTTSRDLVSALRNIAKSFRKIVHMLRQLHQRTLDTGITWPVNWKGIEDTEGHFEILSLMILDKVDQEKEALACETAYKSKSNKIFAALVVMRNWLFYVEGEVYRLVLALQSKISLQELTSALRSLKEGKQEILPFVVYRILAMHPVEESGNGMRYLDEKMSSNITKSILHVVSKLDTILSSLKIPIASIISWEELVACEKSLQEVETELKEIESNMHAGGEAIGTLMQKDEKALNNKRTMHGRGEAGTSLLPGTSFDRRRNDKGKAPMTADMEENGQSSKGQGRKGPRGPGIYINDPSEHQGDRYTNPTQFRKTRPQRRASNGGSSDAGCSRIV